METYLIKRKINNNNGETIDVFLTNGLSEILEINDKKIAERIIEDLNGSYSNMSHKLIVRKNVDNLSVI